MRNLKELNIEMSTFFDEQNLNNYQRTKIIELINQSYKFGFQGGWLECLVVNECQ